MEAAGIEVFRAKIPKGPGSHMKGDGLHRDSLPAEASKHRLAEVKTRGGCGNRPRLVGKDGLVPHGVRIGCLAAQVGWKWNHPTIVHDGHRHGRATNQAASVWLGRSQHNGVFGGLAMAVQQLDDLSIL
jgi:hypothetical protein